jgi:hypothetical protein
VKPASNCEFFIDRDDGMKIQLVRVRMPEKLHRRDAEGAEKRPLIVARFILTVCCGTTAAARPRGSDDD